MTHPLVDVLNDAGFVHRGEEVEVTAVEPYTKTVTTTEESRRGEPIPMERREKFVSIKLVNGEAVEMKRSMVDDMIERLRRRDE